MIFVVYVNSYLIITYLKTKERDMMQDSVCSIHLSVKIVTIKVIFYLFNVLVGQNILISWFLIMITLKDYNSRKKQFLLVVILIIF